MHLCFGDGSRVHRVQRLKLPDAHSRLAGSPGEEAQDDPSGGGAGTIMTSPAREFKAHAQQLTHDLGHRELIQTALKKYEIVRDRTRGAFQDWQAARQAAAEIKWEAMNHLDQYLEEFTAKLEARGTKLHWATTGQQGRDTILGIIRDKKAGCI